MRNSACEVVAVREHRDGDLSTVLALRGLADPAVGDEVDAVCGTAALDEDFARREVALRAAVGEGGEDVRVRESAQQGQLGELPRDHPDRGALLDELDAPVAEGVPQPSVDPVGAAVGLDPGQHAQQPAGGDLLHLRGGLGGGGELAGSGGTQGLLRRVGWGLSFRKAVDGHREAFSLHGGSTDAHGCADRETGRSGHREGGITGIHPPAES
jgi:hypothetical protein